MVIKALPIKTTPVHSGNIGITTTSGRIIAGPKWQATDAWSAMQQRLAPHVPPAPQRAKNFGPSGAAAYVGVAVPHNAPTPRTSNPTAMRLMAQNFRGPEFLQFAYKVFPTMINWSALYEGPMRTIDHELTALGYSEGFVTELRSAIEQSRIDNPHAVLTALIRGVFPQLWEGFNILDSTSYPVPASRPLAAALIYQQFMQPLGIFHGNTSSTGHSKPFAQYLYLGLQASTHCLLERRIPEADHLPKDEQTLLRISLYEAFDRFRLDSAGGMGLAMTDDTVLSKYVRDIMQGTGDPGLHLQILAHAFNTSNYRMAAHLGIRFSELHPELDPEAMIARLAASLDYIYALYHGGHRSAQDSLRWIDNFRRHHLIASYEDGFLGIYNIQNYVLAAKDEAEQFRDSSMFGFFTDSRPFGLDFTPLQNSPRQLATLLSDLEVLPRTFARETLYARAEAASDAYFNVVQALGAHNTAAALLQQGTFTMELLGSAFTEGVVDALEDGNIDTLFHPDNARRVQQSITAFGHIVHTRSAVAQETIQPINLRRLRRPGMRMPELHPEDHTIMAHAAQGMQSALPHLLSFTSDPRAHLTALRQIQERVIAPLRAQYPLRQPHTTPAIAHYLYGLHLQIEIAAQLAEGELRAEQLLN